MPLDYSQLPIPKPEWRKTKRRSQPKIRDQVKKRDGGRCQHPGCGQKSNQLHHIRFRSRGGRNDIENLVTLCQSHHTGDDSPHQSIERRRFWENWSRERYPEYYSEVLNGKVM